MTEEQAKTDEDPPITDDSYRDTLSSLAAAYVLDRAVMDECYPPVIATDQCRYCEGSWRFWKMSRFDGHTRCVVTMPFQRRLVTFFDQNPEMTYGTVAQALGVSLAVVKAWWDNIRNPRKGPRPPQSRGGTGG